MQILRILEQNDITLHKGQAPQINHPFKTKDAKKVYADVIEYLSQSFIHPQTRQLLMLYASLPQTAKDELIALEADAFSAQIKIPSQQYKWRAPYSTILATENEEIY
ncbi:MAG TPA: hypothetical protein VK158_00005, partial [Acidobacteriota bacterium]|nr:hypothetical protein [Acidobacteriota bacterium]